MEDIYYLIHTTNNPDCINWSELRTAEFKNIQFKNCTLNGSTFLNLNQIESKIFIQGFKIYNSSFQNTKLFQIKQKNIVQALDIHLE